LLLVFILLCAWLLMPAPNLRLLPLTLAATELSSRLVFQ